MYRSVKKVMSHENYTLFIEFDNGEKRSLDLKPYLDFGIFRRLKSPGAFQRARVSFDTVEWDCGVDLDPEFIYEKSTETEIAQQIA
jgi:hypothetical protein